MENKETFITAVQDDDVVSPYPLERNSERTSFL